MFAFSGILLGLIVLIAGGILLVRGASAVAESYGVSPMVIGLTIVGFGTSAPELFVNAMSAADGVPGLAFGNVVGSNISNLGLVLGAATLLSPIMIQGEVVRRELPLLLLATTMMTVMALDAPLDGRASVLGRTDAIVLLLMFCIFIYITALDIVLIRREDPLFEEIRESHLVSTSPSGLLRWSQVLGGFVLLFAGGEITVRSGVEFAEQIGMSTTLVGLLVVAVGTSMPELVTSIIAALRKEPDLALGNIIGSNIFNYLFVLPIGGLIAEIPVPHGGVGDLLVSWALTAALIPVFFLGRARFGRVAGAIFLATYAAYVASRIMMI